MTRSAKPRLGILMLDSNFPRVPGDVGNPATWDFPVSYAVVPGATPQAIVREDSTRFEAAFVDAGQDLVADGCTGIATTCGFLSLIRPKLADRLGVPVAASALEQAALVKGSLGPGRSVGVLTISAASLTPAHLSAALVPADTVVQGLDGSDFARTILDDLPELDQDRARLEMAEAARRLKNRAPHLGAVLLECTNMVPYAPDVARATGLPVYSIFTYLNWFHESLAPRCFPVA